MNETINQIAKSVTEMITPDADTKPQFSYNGLATHPIRPAHMLFGFVGRLDVPPGTWGVCYAPNSEPVILEPGTHWLSGLESQAIQVQLVDATRRYQKLDPVTGVTLDGWDVTLQVALVFEVVDPIKIARAADPLATLASVTQAALLAQIESLPHEALQGTIDTPAGQVNGEGVAATGDEGEKIQEDSGQGGEQAAETEPERVNGGLGRRGLEIIEKGLLYHLETRPSLYGLQILDVAVISREGDPRLLDILQGEALARLQAIHGHKTEVAQAEREKMRLEMQVQTAQASRTVSLIEAETQAQLASIEQQIRLVEARAEAEVQEIKQAQEAREAERKRIAEEWRTAKELDLRSMEYQHEETLAIIQGTTEITTEAARNGLLGSIQGNSRRIDVTGEGGEDAVEVGLQVMRGFREKTAPPATHFLPRPSGAGLAISDQERIQAEALRLERLQGAEHEIVVRRGVIAGARVWFPSEAPPALAGFRMEFDCPDGYPLLPPRARIFRDGSATEYIPGDWDAGLFLADLVREAMFELLSKSQ